MELAVDCRLYRHGLRPLHSISLYNLTCYCSGKRSSAFRISKSIFLYAIGTTKNEERFTRIYLGSFEKELVSS